MKRRALQALALIGSLVGTALYFGVLVAMVDEYVPDPVGAAVNAAKLAVLLIALCLAWMATAHAINALRFARAHREEFEAFKHGGSVGTGDPDR